MRFRQLELVRYGGFADRLLDFGAGKPDLHLVVGPNEAGKTTTLQAIGDFLFGMAGQTAQGWRWGYGDLRIRGVLEADGRTIEAVRRKGNKDTLLGPDGLPVQGDPLASLLGGIDRAAFERMFGLDHARLRDGGDAILRGRDDAARITLEAGTGVAGIGRDLDRFAEDAAQLFKPSASKPVINRLMAERSEAQKRVRDAALSERDWSDEKRRRTEAEERRNALLTEADQLSREEARLARISRARAPLARLLAARARSAALGDAAELPADAVDILTRVRGEQRTAGELGDRLQAELVRVDSDLAAVPQPSAVIELADRIDMLEERRPVIEKATLDLDRRLARRHDIDERIAAARRDARFPEGAALPGQGWRRRAVAHLQERREAAVSANASAKRREELAQNLQMLARERAELPLIDGGAAIEAAMNAVPADSAARLARAESNAQRLHERAAEHVRALAPWEGDPVVLNTLELPSPAVAGDFARRLEAAQADGLAARREADAQQGDIIRSEARLAALVAGGELPTAAVVEAARSARDELIARLMAGEQGRAGALLAAVVQADTLADRRDVEAERLAEHASAAAARELAKALQAAAASRAEAREQERRQLGEEWASLLSPLGFARPVAAGDFPAWIDRRAQALASRREAYEAARDVAQLAREVERAITALTAQLRRAGVEPPSAEQDLIAAARDHVRREVATALRREQLDAALTAATRTLATAEREELDQAREATMHNAVLTGLLREAGLSEEVGATGLQDAISALEFVADDVTSRSDLDRQIIGMESDARAFEAETTAVLQALGRQQAETAARVVAGLAIELRQAISNRDRLAALRAERKRLTDDLHASAARRSAAEREIERLRSLAGVEDDEALDVAVSGAVERTRITAAIQEALGELAGLDQGAGLDALAAEVAALSAEDEAVATRRVLERREGIATAREEVGRALAAADEAFSRAAQDSAAADAQQAAVDAGAAMAAAAEAHVEAAAAAALLRWALDRHRRMHQAPLIERAGALFATVTGGAFRGLGVVYDDDDRPVIRAVRSGGEPVGIEGLSEGTRDQLFLALRLGSIETGTHSMPIVCDDLLITADDERAGEMLRVLAAAARRNQVLLFTHHEHLVDVARRTIGPDGFRLHRLTPAVAAAA